MPIAQSTTAFAKKPAFSRASAVLLSGPTAGTTSVAATYQVRLDFPTVTAQVVVTPVADNGGVVSPATLTFNGATNSTQTFTVTRSSDGTSSVSVSNGAGLANGSAISLTTSGAGGGAIAAMERWLYRSTLAGTFRKLRFDTDAAVNNFRFTSGVGLDTSPTPGSVGSFVRRNATEGILGDGALELEQLTNDNMNSYLWLPFDSSRPTWQFNETGFNRGPGEEFYVSVWVKTNCGGDAGVGGGGRKVFSVTRGSNSYTFNELVVQDTLYRGIMQMYQGMGPGSVAYKPFDLPVGGSDFDLQPGSTYAVAPAFCSYSAGSYETQVACASYFDNEWVQYRMHVIPSDDGVSNGTLELEFWKPGMATSKKVISLSGIPMFYDSDKPDGYNHFIAWIYETGRTSGPAGQKQLYDQISISRTAIPFDYEIADNPAWYASATTSEWRAMTGGAADTLASIDPCPSGTCSYSGIERQPSMVTAWCGAAASPSSLITAAQGGHSNYAGNEVNEFVFNVASPRWFMRIAPSTSLQDNVPYYADGKPSSRHGYKQDCFIGTGTNGNRWFAPLGVSFYGSPGGYTNSPSGQGASWQQGAGAYDAQGTFPTFTGLLDYDTIVEYDPVLHKVWVQEGGLTGNWRLFALDVATKVWTTYAGSSVGMQTGVVMACMLDPVRRVLAGQSGSTLWVRDLAFPNNPGRAYTVSGMSGNAIAYEPVSGKWVNWNGGKTLRVITPPSNYRSGDGTTLNALNAGASYTSTTITPGGGATPTAGASNGTYGRFAYIASPRGLCVVNATNEPVYFFKIPAAGI